MSNEGESYDHLLRLFQGREKGEKAIDLNVKIF
jgi:hypothetical protein